MNIKSKFGYLCCASLLTTSLWAQDVLISTRNTSLLLDAPVGGEVRFIYYGDKLSTSGAATLLETEQKTFSAYPVYGLNCPSESALSVTHGDGNMTLQLEVIKVDTRKEQTADITTIRLKDKVYPFYMNLCYRTYPDADIIETWTEITHEEKKRSPSIVSLPLICRSGKETYGFPTYTAHGQTRLNWHKNRYDRASR